MKTFFIGHGSPENAVRDNAYTRYLNKLGKSIDAPRCIIVFSAHWLTGGSFITAGEKPEQIYDFYGFPDELYRIRYQPDGLPSIAEEISAKIPSITTDYERGIDHAAWAVVKHMYPEQNIPVLEMSLNTGATEQEHYELGQKIAELALDDVLFIGSGNLVHNLYEIDFDEHAKTFPWAGEANEWLLKRIEDNSTDELINAQDRMPLYRKAVPTKDHYLPLMYVLGFRKNKTVIEFNDIQNGSISMLSFSVE